MLGPKPSCCSCRCCAWTCLVLLGALVIVIFPVIKGAVITSITGVFETESSDIDGEIEVFAHKLQLKPGMTLCEMGSADGTLMSRLAPKVMPGGKLVATSIKRQELAATADRVDAAGIDADSVLTTIHATEDHWAPGLPDGTCDARECFRSNLGRPLPCLERPADEAGSIRFSSLLTRTFGSRL